MRKLAILCAAAAASTGLAQGLADPPARKSRAAEGDPNHIPLTGLCEAEGEKGSKTRTWFSVKDQLIFAWAGMWKDSVEWGAVYSGLMTDCNEAVRPVHDRMPVLLHEEDCDLWMYGSLDDVNAFQDRCFPDELTVMERTSDPWFRRRESAPA